MSADVGQFYSAALVAGSILSGFCGTFLSFRIQRESAYYRQPALDFDSGTARDIPILLSHFTSSFLLIIVASILALTFGVIVPLLALSGVGWLYARPKLAVAGIIASTIFIAGYFVSELLHYRILSSKLFNDSSEWGRNTKTTAITFLLAILFAALIWLTM